MSDLLTAPPSGPPVEAPDRHEPGPLTPQERRRRRPGRFFGGLVTGVAVAVAVAGGVYVAGDDGGGGDALRPATAPDAAGATPVGAVAPGSSLHDLVIAVRPSIVAVHTTVTQTDVFGNRLEGAAAGTGFVLSADGLIVTNSHVIDGAEQISVTLGDQSTEDAELVAADPRSDLAVLRIARNDLTPLALGDSSAIDVGDPVVAIGNALDLGAEPTVTSGIVSAVDRTLTEPNGEVLVNLIQTDAAINPGNSGGPLLDLSGRVIGINTVVAGQAQNIGFAIAIKPAQVLIDQLRNGQVPRHALLGVSTRQATDDTGVAIDGAAVADVEPNSAADEAGVRAGDVITELDGEAIASPDDLVAAIAGHEPGDVIMLTVERGGKARQLSATLGAHDELAS
jgi:S1-C subfamily serine protease